MVPRDSYSEQIISGFKYNPIVSLIGARQVGKTTLMNLYVKNRKHLWLDGQNPETGQLFEHFSTIERFLEININPDIDGFLVIDEFQYINDISLFLKLLVDKHKKLKILCSGSSSLNILRHVEESLAGRIRLIPVYPLSFDEFVLFQNKELHEALNKCTYNDDITRLFPQISNLLNEYLLYGGMPKIALALKHNDKEALLDDIRQTYLLKDVRQYIKNQDFIAFNKLLKLLSSQIGNLLNINEISRTIQLPYKSCEEYIALLEQMFIIKLVSPFSTNARKEISKMKKLYFYDIGLRNSIYNSFNDIDIRVDNGQLFENFVFLQLLKNYSPDQIRYYRTKDGTEIDFILLEKNNVPVPIVVKYKEFEKHKNLRAISELQKLIDLHSAFIINKNLIQKTDSQHYIQPFLLSRGLPDRINPETS